MRGFRRGLPAAGPFIRYSRHKWTHGPFSPDHHGADNHRFFFISDKQIRRFVLSRSQIFPGRSISSPFPSVTMIATTGHVTHGASNKLHDGEVASSSAFLLPRAGDADRA